MAIEITKKPSKLARLFTFRNVMLMLRLKVNARSLSRLGLTD
nr:hypothetical protein [Escherichia coli J53]